MYNVFHRVREQFFYGHALYNPRSKSEVFVEKILTNEYKENISPIYLRELKKVIYLYKVLNMKYKRENHHLFILNRAKSLEIALTTKTVGTYGKQTSEKEELLLPFKKRILKMTYQLGKIKKILTNQWGFSFDQRLDQPLYTKQNTNPYFSKPIYKMGRYLKNVVNNKAYVELCPKALYRFNPSFHLMYNIIYEEKKVAPTKVSEFTNLNILAAI